MGLDQARMPTLHDLLERRVAEQPDRVYIENVGGGAVTYAEAHERARGWAGALQQLGVGPGDAVSTMLLNSLECVLVWLGTSALRGYETAVHPSYRGHMLEYAITNVQAETLVIHESFVDRLADSAPNLPTVKNVVVVGATGELPKLPFDRVVHAADLLDDAPAPVGLEPPQPWDLAAIVYTSGTTGPSKGVMIPWGQLAAFSVRVFPVEDLDDSDCLYLPGVASHIGSKSWPYLAAYIGGRLVMRQDFKTDTYLQELRDHRCTTTAMVGAMAYFLQSHPPSPADRDIPLKNVVMAPAIPGLDGFKERFGVRVCTCYSMTELSSPFASEGWDVENWQSVGKLKGGHPGVEVRVVDEHDYDVGPNTLGELIVRTSAPWTLNLGYYGMPEASNQAWRNGWFHTGDGFVYDEDGYWYFVDRLKDTIRRRGENISSFEVEQQVNQHPAVAESAAVAVPSEVSEDEIKVFVVPAPGQDVDPREMIEFLAPRMPRYMVPRYVEVVAELPKTMGTLRIKKGELRAAALTPGTWDREAAGVVLPK